MTNEKKHRNVVICLGVLNAIVSEISNYVGAFLIFESIGIINFLQIMEKKQSLHDVQAFLALFDSQKLFLNLSASAMILTLFIAFLRLIFKKTNYFPLRFFTILICYAIAGFYGCNNINPYGSIKLEVLVCIVLVLGVLRAILECLYNIDWSKINTRRFHSTTHY